MKTARMQSSIWKMNCMSLMIFMMARMKRSEMAILDAMSNQLCAEVGKRWEEECKDRMRACET
jgi:hypothetical protein